MKPDINYNKKHIVIAWVIIGLGILGIVQLVSFVGSLL